ncbi:MAG: hypothetical protein K2K04_06880, partial [Clostridia bacterium]|nr:hypothetical protein [Clostridia bacterium]
TILSSLFLILTIIGFVGCILGFIQWTKNQKGIGFISSGVLELLLIIGGILSIIFFVLSIKSLKKYCKKLSYSLHVKRMVVSAREDIPYWYERVEKEKKSVELSKNRLTSLQERATAELQIINNDYNLGIKQIKEHIQTTLSLINFLKTVYAQIIDMRDWVNLDIIIYALETKRADNMKEALNIVDSEKRSERIADAITQANYEISRILNNGFKNIQNELVSGFNNLSEVITKEMQKTRSAINMQSKLTMQLISQSTLQNALIANANESSAVLAQKVESMNSYLHKIA